MGIKQLRDKFFRECCAKQEDGLQDVNMTPHNTFEWFVKYFGKSLTPFRNTCSNMVHIKIYYIISFLLFVPHVKVFIKN